MVYGRRWMVVALIIAGPQLWGCSEPTPAKGGPAKSSKVEPGKVERLEGGLSRVTLTARAAERLDIKTAAVRLAPATRTMEREAVAAVGASGKPLAVQPWPSTADRQVVPYASVVYEPHGETWVYTSPAPLAFVRERVKIDYIEGDVAVLSEGPPAGTAVVTVGVAELFGIDFGIGK